MLLVMGVLIATASAPMRVALPGLTGVGVSAEQAAALSEHLSLNFREVSIVTRKEMTSLIGLERQRQLAGCTETSCMAELANALGVDGVLIGDLTRIGAVTQVNLKIISATDGRRLAGFSERVTKEEDLFEALERGAQLLEAAALLAFRRGSTVDAGLSGKPRLSRLWALVPGLVGVAGLGAGIALRLSANADYAALTRSTAPDPWVSPLELRQSGESKQLGAGVAIAVGLIGLVAAVVLVILGDGP